MIESSTWCVFLSITSSLLFKQSMKTNQGCCFASPMPEASGEHFHFAVVLEKVAWSGAIALVLVLCCESIDLS